MDVVIEKKEGFDSFFLYLAITSESSLACLSQPTQGAPHLNEANVLRKAVGSVHAWCASLHISTSPCVHPYYTEMLACVTLSPCIPVQSVSAKILGMGAGKGQQAWLWRSHDLH